MLEEFDSEEEDAMDDQEAGDEADEEEMAAADGTGE